MLACKCRENGSQMNCDALMARLQAVDFAIVETVLYLDAYPTSRKALDYYARLVAERSSLAEALHTQCGKPTTAWDNKNPNGWDWIKSPWPWQIEAN